MNVTVEKAKLLSERESFEAALQKRIDLGKSLSLLKVPTQEPIDPYLGYGYARRKQRIGLTEEQEKWISEFKQWTDYNCELLKQAFDIPNNEYHRDYVNSGQSLFFTGDEDVVQLYKDELKRKIEYLETLVLKIPCCHQLPYKKKELTRKVLSQIQNVFLLYMGMIRL